MVRRLTTLKEKMKVSVRTALALALLGGCLANAANSESSTTAVENNAQAAENSPSDNMPPENENTAHRDGPLDEFMVQIFGVSFQDATPQEAREMNERFMAEREEFVAACMREKGFIYSTFALAREPVPIRVPPPDEARYGTREWAESWGFGISTRPPITSQRVVRQRQTSGAGVRVFAPPENSAEMSAAELEAWYLAMYGVTLASLPPQVEFTFDGFPWADVPEQDLGCETRWGLHQSLPPLPFQGLQDELNRLDGVLLADPRTLELDAAWASCMIDAGEGGWSNPRQPFEVLSPLFWQDEVPVEELVAWDWAAEPDGPPQPDRSEFRARELAVAVADWDCRDQIGYDAVIWDIDLDLQQAFVNQHRNELEAWVEYASQQRAAP